MPFYFRIIWNYIIGAGFKIIQRSEQTKPGWPQVIDTLEVALTTRAQLR